MRKPRGIVIVTRKVKSDSDSESKRFIARYSDSEGKWKN
jgi:hypothetical protein